jgi:Resolvase, N terminal domain
MIVAEFYDAAVSGGDPIAERPGFKAMLDRIAGNGVRCIIVESPDRFARDLTVQLTGHDFLKSLGIALIPGLPLHHVLRNVSGRLQPLRYLHSCPGCFRLERLPGGICTHWKAPPFHGARHKQTAALQRTTCWLQRPSLRSRQCCTFSSVSGCWSVGADVGGSVTRVPPCPSEVILKLPAIYCPSSSMLAV